MTKASFPAAGSISPATIILTVVGSLLLAQIWFISESLGMELLLGVIFAGLVLACIRFPEVGFALTLNAGMFKEDPRLDILSNYIDITILFLILSGLGLAYCTMSGHLTFSIPPNTILLPFVAIVLLACISLTYTIAPIYGTDKFGRLSVLTLAAFMGPAALFQDEERLKRFFGTYTALSSIMVLTLISGGLQANVYEQQFVFSSGYLGLGSITSQATLMLLLFFLPSSRRFGSRIICLVLLLLNSFGIFASGARGSAIGFSAAVGCVFLYAGVSYIGNWQMSKGRREINSRVLRHLVVFAGLIILGFWQLSSYFITLFGRTEELIYSLGYMERERIDMYYKSIQAMLDLPRGLWGLGFGGWSMYYTSFFGFDQPRGGSPHNVLLEVGVEIGWLGLACLVAMLSSAVLRGFRNLRKDGPPKRYLMSVTVVALFVFMFAYSSVHGDITDCRQLFTWIGAIYAVERLSLSGSALSQVPPRNLAS